MGVGRGGAVGPGVTCDVGSGLGLGLGLALGDRLGLGLGDGLEDGLELGDADATPEGDGLETGVALGPRDGGGVGPEATPPNRRTPSKSTNATSAIAATSIKTARSGPVQLRRRSGTGGGGGELVVRTRMVAVRPAVGDPGSGGASRIGRRPSRLQSAVAAVSAFANAIGTGRWPGSEASAAATGASKNVPSSGRTSDGGGIGDPWAFTNSRTVPAGCGSRPVSAWYTTTPSANTSAAGVASPPASSSGARYASVPTAVPGAVNVLVESPVRAIPKSPSFAPPVVSRMLCGLTSRWTKPRACRLASPPAMSRIAGTTSSGGSRPPRAESSPASDPRSQSSMTKNGSRPERRSAASTS